MTAGRPAPTTTRKQGHDPTARAACAASDQRMTVRRAKVASCNANRGATS